MKRFVGGCAAVALSLGLMATMAEAQIDKIAVFHSPGFGTGVEIAGDFGFGINEDTEFFIGEKPLAYGGRVTLGLPFVKVMVGAARVDPKDPNDPAILDPEIAFGGNVALSVFNVPLLPVAVDLQAGFGYVKFGEGVDEQKQLDIPIGIGVGIKPPLPGLSVEPWAAPRIHIQRFEFGGESTTEFGFGASGGVNLTLPVGVGLHAAVDWYTLDFEGVSFSPLILTVGAHFKFAVPGLGMATGLLGG